MIKTLFAALCFFASSCQAGIYFTQDAIDEGVIRGQQSQFSGIGTLIIYEPSNQSSTAQVGYLVNNSQILTISHGPLREITKENVSGYICGFQLQIGSSIAPSLFPVDLESIQLCPIKQLGQESLVLNDPKYGGDLRQKRIIGHPNYNQSADIAIISLKLPLPSDIGSIPKFDLLLDRPVNEQTGEYKKWSTGYVVTTNVPMIFKTPTTFTKEDYLDFVRMVGIVKMAEDAPSNYLFSSWDIDDAKHKQEHKLQIIGRHGDSGAPLIVKDQGILKIAGLFTASTYVGIGNSLDYGTCFYVPLFPYKEWLSKVLTM